MPITAECPNCGFKGNVPDQFKGKKVKCRKCASPFLVGGPAPAPSKNGSAERKSNPDLVEMEVVEEKSPPVRRARPTEQGFVLPDPEPAGSPFSNLDEPEAPAPRKAKPSAQGTRPAKTNGSAQGIKPAKSSGSAQGTKPKPKDSSAFLDLDEAPRKKGGKRSFKKKDMEQASIVVVVLGVMALVLSGAALGVGSLGLVGLISVPLSGLGLLLSIGGVVMAWGRPGLRILVPGFATLLSLVALPVAGWFSYKVIDSGALNNKDDVQAQAPATNAAPPPAAATQPTPQGGTADTKPNTAPMPPATQPKKDPPPPTENYVDALREKSQIGAMRIQVTKVDIDAKAKRMLVHLSMENTSTDQFIEYLGWGALDRDPAPILKDNLPPPQQGTYKRLLPAPGETIPNQVETFTFKPGTSKVDVVAFEVPSDKVLFLHLDLPAANLDDGKLKGAFKFKIPKSMLLGSGPLDPNPKDPPKDPKDPPKDPKKEAPKDPMFVTKRVLILNDAKMRVPQKIAALRELAEIGEFAADAAPIIAQVLGNKMMDEQLRAQAAETLGEIGPKAGAQVEALRRAIREDTFHVVKAKAARALGQMGKVAGAALPDLEALLTSKDEGVPEEAKRAINRIKNAK